MPSCGTLTDIAIVSNLVNPVPGAGTVEFRLYRPGDTRCELEPVLIRSSVPLTLNATATGGTATSAPGYVPTEVGTCRWRAFYSGDANNAAVDGSVQRRQRVDHGQRASPAGWRDAAAGDDAAPAAAAGPGHRR